MKELQVTEAAFVSLNRDFLIFLGQAVGGEGFLLIFLISMSLTWQEVSLSRLILNKRCHTVGATDEPRKAQKCRQAYRGEHEGPRMKKITLQV